MQPESATHMGVQLCCCLSSKMKLNSQNNNLLTMIMHSLCLMLHPHNVLCCTKKMVLPTAVEFLLL